MDQKDDLHEVTTTTQKDVARASVLSIVATIAMICATVLLIVSMFTNIPKAIQFVNVVFAAAFLTKAVETMFLHRALKTLGLKK